MLNVLNLFTLQWLKIKCPLGCLNNPVFVPCVIDEEDSEDALGRLMNLRAIPVHSMERLE